MRIFVSLLVASLFLFSSCEDDEVSAPEIEITEIGYENSGVAYAGDDLHINAAIVAEAKIDFLRLIIHPEGEHDHTAEEADQHESWEVDTTFTTGFSGLKNSILHQHFDVPDHAEEGEYHLHLSVTDMEGNLSAEEANFDVIYDPNHEHNHEH